MLIVVLAGCSSLGKGTQQKPTLVPFEAQASSAVSEEMAREEIGALLEAAQDAVARGGAEDFADCEVAVLEALARLGGHVRGDDDLYLLASEVYDELDRLAAQLQPVPADVEPPPDPGPVAAERVAQEQAKAREQRFDLPVVVNAEVTSLVQYYVGPYRDRLVIALERASTLLPFIREELRKADLPEDLAWLPLVESAFNIRARSRAKAQGLWQFMAGTAKIYGLRCDQVVDERNDPYLATRAAVAHLGDLHRTFGDWELALAAYNSGTGRVQRALNKSSDRDFWEMRRLLPRETRNYVPAMWAALLVAKNPTAYGLPVFEERSPCLDRVTVRGALDLEVLADRASLEADLLAELNPALIQRITPAGGSFELAVPCGSQERIATTIAAIPANERIRRVFHKVARGDTLAAIARRYDSTVNVLMAANNITDPRRLRIGQNIMIPKFPLQAKATVAAKAQPARNSGKSARHQRYVVQRGDTLFAIARRFGISVEQLRRHNNLGGTVIRPGDVLMMP